MSREPAKHLPDLLPMQAESDLGLTPMTPSPKTSRPFSDESLDAYVEQAVERVLKIEDQAEAEDVELMD
jgi:hypothetical protein